MLIFKRTIFLFKASFIVFLLRFKGYAFRVVEDSKEVDAVAILKYRIYHEEGYIDSNAHPNGRLDDNYSQYSINLGAFFHGKLVGTVRLIKDSEYGFPTERLFNIEKMGEREKTLEVGRLVIDRSFRVGGKGKSRTVMFGLAYLLLSYSIRHGIKFWIANMPEQLALSYRQFGAHFMRLSEQTLTEENIVARSVIAGYFAKKVLAPYFLEIITIFENGFSLKRN